MVTIPLFEKLCPENNLILLKKTTYQIYHCTANESCCCVKHNLGHRKVLKVTNHGVRNGAVIVAYGVSTYIVPSNSFVHSTIPADQKVVSDVAPPCSQGLL